MMMMMEETKKGKNLTLILHWCDVSLGSPVNSIRQSYSTGRKES